MAERKRRRTRKPAKEEPGAEEHAPPTEEQLAQTGAEPTASGYGLGQPEPEFEPKVDSLWDKSYLAEYIEDYWDNPNEQGLRQAVADWVGDGSGSALLDVGCGSARVAPMLRGWEYTGVDGSEKLLAYAAKRVKPSSLVVGDLTKPLPFRDGEFDVVICMNVFRHLESYQGPLAEMVRVARKAVYIVDMWSGRDEHVYGETEMAGIVFPNNIWSLATLTADAVRLGCRAERHEFQGLAWPVTGLKLGVA